MILYPMKTLLICHDRAQLDQVVLARWMNSFSSLLGIVIIQEPASRIWRRVRREVKRIGVLRFFDVLAFQFYYRLFLVGKDQRWERQRASPEMPYLWGHCFGDRDFENVEPEHSRDRNIYQEFESRHCSGALQGITERERFFDSGQGNIRHASGNLSRIRNAHGCF